MKPTRNLRLRLRLIEGALVLLLGALATAAVATHQLLLDATNRPTDDVSFSGPHWVGTLDAARLPASVPLLDSESNLYLPGNLRYGGFLLDALGGDGFSLWQNGTLHLDDAATGSGGLFIGGNLIADAGHLYANGNLIADGNGNLATGYFQLVDASNNIYCGTGDPIADGDGYLRTGSQSYQPGAVTPTGYLLLKDTSGNIYQVPAAAAAP